jgi:hypothetical protein
MYLRMCTAKDLHSMIKYSTRGQTFLEWRSSSKSLSFRHEEKEKKKGGGGVGDSKHLLHGGKDPPEEATYGKWFCHVAVLSSVQAEGDRG